MQVLSVNVGQVQAVSYQGERHQTGIFKQAVSGPVLIHSLGLAGDRVCDLFNHGGADKAVYAFSAHHHPYWQQALDSTELAPGAFGENLTVDQLDEGQICIGDQLRAGNALLEVSQPRVPCFKLGIALGDEGAPALFTRYFHTGVYFRVLEEGTVCAGDPIEITHRHPQQLSVHALFRAFYDRDYPQRESLLQGAREIGELAAEWQDKLRTRR